MRPPARGRANPTLDNLDTVHAHGHIGALRPVRPPAPPASGRKSPHERASRPTSGRKTPHGRASRGHLRPLAQVMGPYAPTRDGEGQTQRTITPAPCTCIRILAPVAPVRRHHPTPFAPVRRHHPTPFAPDGRHHPTPFAPVRRHHPTPYAPVRRHHPTPYAPAKRHTPRAHRASSPTRISTSQAPPREAYYLGSCSRVRRTACESVRLATSIRLAASSRSATFPSRSV